MFMNNMDQEELKRKEVEAPLPKDNEVLRRVHVSAVNYGNVWPCKADPFAGRFMLGLISLKKQILGLFAGEIVASGKNVMLLTKVIKLMDRRYGFGANNI